MSPADFVSAMDAVQRALAECRGSEVLATLQPYSAASRPSAAELLSCFATLAGRYAHFTANSRAVMRALGLQPLVDPGWWADLVLAVTRGTMPAEFATSVADLHARLEMTTGSLSDLAHLLDPSDPAIATSNTTLTLMLPDEGRTPASPRRVAEAIQAISQMWDALGQLDRQFHRLTLTSCEAGLPTRLVFSSGTPSRMAEMKALLLSVWGLVVTYHAASPGERAAGIPSLLPIMAQMEALGGPDAADARQRLESGVRQFLEAGCIMQEMRDPGLLTPERLLVPSMATSYATPPRSAPAPAGPPAAPFEPSAVEAEMVIPDHLADLIADERQRLTAIDSSLQMPPYASPTSGVAAEGYRT